jgi:tetratricopeptide (TPR) repeat protein
MKHIPSSLRILALTMVASLLLTPPSTPAIDAQPEPSDPEVTPATQDVSPELMRAFLHLQEQVHSMQMAVERSRMEADAAAARNAEVLNARLKLIEKSIEAQQDANSAVLEASTAVKDAGVEIQKSNRLTMLFAGLIATVGFLALAVTGWLQWKTVTRINSTPSAVGYPSLLPPQGYGALGFGPSGTPPDTRLMDALGRLEHRIADMEIGHHEPLPTGNRAATHEPDTTRATDTELASLIREGETLLAQEQAEQAIEHFDSILAKHPGHPEVLLHKGAALERLQKDEEAIKCYDQAIRADKTLTMAYLHKGGLFNRMEKFNEAMECYEQALKVQEGRTTVS